jgi:hypothetical protein
MADKDRKTRLMQRAFILCKEAGIDRADRIELAKNLLDLGEYSIESFKGLTEGELADLVFGLEAWKMIQEARNINGVTLTEAKALVRAEEFADPSSTTLHGDDK